MIPWTSLVIKRHVFHLNWLGVPNSASFCTLLYHYLLWYVCSQLSHHAVLDWMSYMYLHNVFIDLACMWISKILHYGILNNYGPFHNYHITLFRCITVLVCDTRFYLSGRRQILSKLGASYFWFLLLYEYVIPSCFCAIFLLTP